MYRRRDFDSWYYDFSAMLVDGGALPERKQDREWERGREMEMETGSVTAGYLR